MLALLLVGVGGACGGAAATPAAPSTSTSRGALHAVEIRAHPGLGRLDGTVEDVRGAPAGVRCNTCHTSWVTGAPARRPQELDEFHEDMIFRHGNLACASCHDPDNHERVRLASGETFPLSETMALCAQCHGPQHRDYRNGSHGGMSGYWDLTRGPRVRNHCVNCHDPHAPAWDQVLPAPPPRDRFLTSSHREGAHHE
ncbi:MAG: hypothetical protein AB2A00_28150 [Myxococcota bacterium]